MPKDKDLKRRVRERMAKTGEAYTTARSHILSDRTKPVELPPDYAELAGMADDTIREKTGQGWPGWVRALDAIGASRMKHGDIAAHVREQTGLDWWSQTVAVGYERIRGLRAIGQRRDGTFEAGKSRTFPVPVDRLFDAFSHEPTRRRWLDVDLHVRKATKPKSIRITWPDDTSVEVYFTPKGESKTSVAVQHSKLPDREAVDAMKAFWHERLDALGEVLG